MTDRITDEELERCADTDVLYEGMGTYGFEVFAKKWLPRLAAEVKELRSIIKLPGVLKPTPVPEFKVGDWFVGSCSYEDSAVQPRLRKVETVIPCGNKKYGDVLISSSWPYLTKEIRHATPEEMFRKGAKVRYENGDLAVEGIVASYDSRDDQIGGTSVYIRGDAHIGHFRAFGHLCTLLEPADVRV